MYNKDVFLELAREKVVDSKEVYKEDVKEGDFIVEGYGCRYKIELEGVSSNDIDMLVRLKQLSYIRTIKSIIVTQFVLGIISAIIFAFVMLSI